MSTDRQYPVTVVTGAAGQVGAAIRPLLRGVVSELRLVDRLPIDDLHPGETQWTIDARDSETLRSALAGASALIHLAGIARDAPLDTLRRESVELTASVLQDAERSGVRRIALASTMHVLGGYRRLERIRPTSTPRPDSHYAASKVCIELLGRRHAAATGARVCSVRIGCLKPLAAQSEPVGWIGPTDLARLFLHALFHPRGAVPVIHAVAPHRGDDCGQRSLWWRHGFRFQERGETRTAGLARARDWYAHDPVAREYRGGEFASAGRRYGLTFADFNMANCSAFTSESVHA